MEKNPISLLQELAVIYHCPLPIYEITAENWGFKSTVLVCNIKASAIGDNKKNAKRLSAERALDILNKKSPLPISGISSCQKEMKIVTTVSVPGIRQEPLINAVGTLNEFCSQRQAAYPLYVEGFENGQFAIHCTLFKFTTTGRGSTKKTAKQNAAKEMLTRVKDYNPRGDEILVNIAKQPELSLNELNEVIKKYDALAGLKNSFKKPYVEEEETKSTFKKTKCENFLSEDELMDKLKKLNVQYKIFTLQYTPHLVLVLETEQTENMKKLTFMCSDDTYEKTKIGLLQNAVSGIECLKP